MLNRIRIILLHTSHPGNIGATARAMKNMGLENLCLVAPKKFPSNEAIALASGADDILAKARVVKTLEEAIEDVRLVLGASARERRLSWPVINARSAGTRIVSELQDNPEHEVAVLFGSEQTGLLNEELQRCHAQLFIPANQAYASLNLAQAVQVVCYEIQMAFQEKFSPFRVPLKTETTPLKTDQFATAAEMQSFYTHLEETLVNINFLDPKIPGQLMSRLRRLYNRARPDKVELNILRGILTATQKQV